jgi:hypothetical protein
MIDEVVEPADAHCAGGWHDWVEKMGRVRQPQAFNGFGGSPPFPEGEKRE